jgi:hypothetical protein
MFSRKSLPAKSAAIPGVLVMTFILLSGCSTSVFTTPNVTYPVLVGPVDRINGKPATTARQCTELTIDAKTMKWFAGAGCSGSEYNYHDTSGLFDYRILLAEPAGLTRSIEIEEIATGAMSGGGIFFANWGDLAWSNVRIRLCDR